VTIPDPAAALQSVLHFFLQGGFFMIPLMLCSVASVGVIIVRSLALRRSVVMPAAIEQEIEAIQPGDEGNGVVRLARTACLDQSALGRITDVALRHLNWPKAENNEAVQTRARHEIVRLESGLFILEIVVGIAPLLGLLGAVSGLVGVFAAFGSDASAQDPHGIAKGISEALSTTIVGLAIAIPSLIAYSHFARKVETMAAEMESIVADLLTKCYVRKERQSAARPPAHQSGYPPLPMEKELL
jgi:biopolymer transport protein ExbB